MELMELRGTIYKIDQTKEVGKNGFKKREFVVVEDDKFANRYLIQMFGNDVDKLKNFSELDKVSCKLALNSREWISPENEEKYFLNLKCISIAQDLTEDKEAVNKEQEDGLPF